MYREILPPVWCGRSDVRCGVLRSRFVEKIGVSKAFPDHFVNWQSRKIGGFTGARLAVADAKTCHSKQGFEIIHAYFLLRAPLGIQKHE